MTADILRRLMRLEARVEIENLINRMWYYQEAGEFEKKWDIFSKRQDTSLEIGARGVYIGPQICFDEAVRHERFYQCGHDTQIRIDYPELEAMPPRTGMLEAGVNGTAVIEVASDAQSAKGVWMTLMSGAKARIGQYGTPKPFWVLWKTSADFVYEDGRWRVWHMWQNPYYIADYLTDWVQSSMKMPDPANVPGNELRGIIPGASVPQDYTTAAYKPYRLTMVPGTYPDVPEPYDTFDAAKRK